jgi:PASTA domain
VTPRLSVTAFRLIVLVAVWVLGTSTLSLAQEDPAESTQPSTPESPLEAPAGDPTLIVPDVRGLPYVFAKGELEDAGFAWKVEGKVEGFAVNLVAAQSVKPGTEVVDTGAPTVALRLETNPSYEAVGMPESESPYPGTKLQLVGDETPQPATESDNAAAESESSATASGEGATDELDGEAEAAGTEPAETEPSAGPETIASEPAAETTEAEATAEPYVEPESETRPPAFVVSGAPSEPLEEIPLPQRASELSAWEKKLQELTPAALDHFAYQHAWIVTGAKFGWWRGAEALRTLITVDQRLVERFEVGAEYETEARAALAEVLRRSR